MGARLIGVVADGDRGRVYLSPNVDHERVALSAKPTWAPDQEISYDPHSGATYCVLYGLTRFSELFTDRQLMALTTFSDMVQEARVHVTRDTLADDLSDVRQVDSNGAHSVLIPIP